MNRPDDLVGDYLSRLDRALTGLPRERRREIVEEISEHITAAREELPPGDEAALRNLLDRLGDPEQIAADARERFGVPARDRGWLEIAAIVLLLVGGFFFVAGWVVGVALLWLSSIWTLRDKLIGTFVVPGGLLLPLALATGAIGGYTQTCSSVDGGEEVCTPGPPLYETALWIALFVVAVVGPIVTAVYLARRSRRLTLHA
jgi:hypothetical protein